jgi:hypothetical protein
LRGGIILARMQRRAPHQRLAKQLSVARAAYGCPRVVRELGYVVGHGLVRGGAQVVGHLPSITPAPLVVAPFSACFLSIASLRLCGLSVESLALSESTLSLLPFCYFLGLQRSLEPHILTYRAKNKMQSKLVQTSPSGGRFGQVWSGWSGASQRTSRGRTCVCSVSARRSAKMPTKREPQRPKRPRREVFWPSSAKLQSELVAPEFRQQLKAQNFYGH